MKQLNIKHLAPYLPYGLKGNLLCGDGVFDNTQEITIGLLYTYGISRFKPILHQLDYLPKEITHNGETFVPIEKLDFKAENVVTFTKYDSLPNELTITATYKQMGDIFTDFIICRNSFDLVNHWIVQQLIEWHFDVFSLINDGLAIPVTETFNPYK